MSRGRKQRLKTFIEVEVVLGPERGRRWLGAAPTGSDDWETA